MTELLREPSLFVIFDARAGLRLPEVEEWR
jgi:hypothetical protein